MTQCLIASKLPYVYRGLIADWRLASDDYIKI